MKKYRILKLGEKIEHGDQYLDGHWREHEDFHIGTEVGIGHYKIRREIKVVVIGKAK